MVIFTKKENDPVDIVHERSWLIRQQKTRIKSMIEMEPSNPKLSPHIDRAMRVYDSFLQSYQETCFDLGLMKRVPKVVPAIETFLTPAQAKFQDQVMRGLLEQERAKAQAAQAAEKEAIWREGCDSIVQDYAARGIALEFPHNATQEEQRDFFDEAFERLMEMIEMNKNGLSHEAEAKELLQ